LVTAVTALVTVGWVAAVTPLIVLVRPDSAPAVWLGGFGPPATASGWAGGAAGLAGFGWLVGCAALGWAGAGWAGAD